MKKDPHITISLLLIALVGAILHTACGKPSAETSSPEFTLPEWGSHLIPEMVWVQGGTFRMGSEEALDLDAKPVHTVTLDSFYIAKNLVTQAQYAAIKKFNPSNYQGGGRPPIGWGRSDLPEGLTSGDELPVEQVTWFDAVEFCNKLSELEELTPAYKITNRTPATGYSIMNADVVVNWDANGYRLPTEAEWEYAAKEGNGLGPYFIYSGSNDPELVAWYSKNASRRLAARATLPPDIVVVTTGHNLGEDARTYPVGIKQPNSLGIYDMSGNVWEWCWDWFDEYPASPQTNPKGPASGTQRVRRGGAASYLGENIVRIAFRDFYFPFYKNSVHGFRMVRGK
jgi:formylglycine-generating enzyme required for sulfatase activity